MKKKNIIQFMPYFPPHIGGVEKVGEDIFLKWTHGKSFVFYGELDNKKYVYNENHSGKVDNKKHIGYPIFDIVDNFPFPLIWTKKYRSAMTELKVLIDANPDEDFYVITHTRFFLSSFLGGRFARKNKLKWIHIEHGSDYVKLSSSFKNKIAYLYDRSIGKYIFKNADKVLAISQAAQKFIESEFLVMNSHVWYRGVDFPQLKSQTLLKNMFPGKIIVGYVGRLYKWKNVGSLISAYYKIKTDKNIQLVIVGDGEDYHSLKKQDVDNSVYFTGGVDAQSAYQLQSEFDIHIHPSSPGGGLATTIMQAMHLGCIIVATPYEGANEVIVDGKNGILLNDDSVTEIKRGIQNACSEFESKSILFTAYNKVFIKKECNVEKQLEKLYKYLD